MKNLLAVIVIALFIGGVIWAAQRPAKTNTTNEPIATSTNTPTSSQTTDNSTASTQPNASVTPSDSLKIVTTQEGSGVAAKNGDMVDVNYTGKLTDGTIFDSSIPRGQPFSFILGGGEVIKGWDQGIIGMKVGEKRTLTIPASLGYGAQGYPPNIPPNATLVFDVELVKIK